ncbi:MAG: hypothetical protein CMH57_03200 [Myxococcales bacterium]|nr:hypothetical protein [Myxococcales bacterium]
MALVGAALLALAAWGIMKAVELREASAPVESTSYVPAQFKRLRDSPGHVNHGDANVPCRACHNLDGEEIRGPKQDACVGCHEGIETEIHEAARGQGNPGCQSCHLFTPGEANPAKSCLGCHSEVADAKGEPPRIGAHAGVACLTCHRQHETAAPTPGDCATSGCHDAVTSRHGDREGAGQCLQCHAVHEGAGRASQKCAACHSKSAHVTTLVPDSAIFEGGHDACTSCHSDHAFDKAAVKGCTDGCHTNVRSSVAKGAHTACASCHAPHNVKTATRSCSKGGCHAEVKHEHPQRQCTACHQPHSGDVARPCAGCHEEVAASAPHASELSCERCHSTHQARRSVQGAQLCVRCHGAQAREAQANAGHANCQFCHAASTGHDSSQPPRGCASCHAEQQRSAPKGHQPCKSCHVTHSGALRPRASDCASCHTRQARSHHGGATCGSCHRPHGPGGVAAPPSCTSCHTARLPGLHRIKDHGGGCGRCHTAHGATPAPTRAACLSCHKDKSNHEPTAKRCTGCHVFGE